MLPAAPSVRPRSPIPNFGSNRSNTTGRKWAEPLQNSMRQDSQAQTTLVSRPSPNEGGVQDPTPEAELFVESNKGMEIIAHKEFCSEQRFENCVGKRLDGWTSSTRSHIARFYATRWHELH